MYNKRLIIQRFAFPKMIRNAGFEVSCFAPSRGLEDTHQGFIQTLKLKPHYCYQLTSGLCSSAMQATGGGNLVAGLTFMSAVGTAN